MPNSDETGISATTVLADPEFRYYPLWDVRANDVFCYICEPFWTVGDGAAHPEEDFTAAFTDPKRLLALDLETLRHAISRVEEVTEGYGVFPVMIPVHYETLADADTWQAYLDACNQSVWSVIDFLNFEIIRLPSPVNTGELTQIIQQLQPFCNNVMLRLAVDFAQFDDMAQSNVDCLGLDIRGDERPEDVILENLKEFSSQAGTRGLSKYVHGIVPASLSLAAVATGYDYVGSDAIAAPLEEWAPNGDSIAPVDLLKVLLKAKST